MILPELYHRGKAGQIFVWAVHTEGAAIVTTYGQYPDGKLQTTSKLATAMNVGRANATTPEEQAEFEAEAMWKHKRDVKYSQTPEQATEPLLLPMLAHKYEPKRVTFPCHVQPKLDGVRCLAVRDPNGEIRLLSRTGKPYNVPHIVNALKSYLPLDSILDGELYIHESTLQHINSLVKRNRPDSSELQFWIYDAPRWHGGDGQPWKSRHAILESLNEILTKVLRESALNVIPTLIGHSDAGIQAAQKFYVLEGFEGAIVRNFDGLYLYGYRSHDLLKVKTFQDAEFPVVGAEDGVGRFVGSAIFQCALPDGRTFGVVPKGTTKVRQEYYADRAHYIGKRLTVRYFNLTPDGIPFHPVGVVFRLSEDLP